MTDAERELAWRGLVASMPGNQHVDRVLSLLLYTARDLVEGGVARLIFRYELDDGDFKEFTARRETA